MEPKEYLEKAVYLSTYSLAAGYLLLDPLGEPTPGDTYYSTGILDLWPLRKSRLDHDPPGVEEEVVSKSRTLLSSGVVSGQ